jgi:cyclopropane fatty-acyl-phospholipid synthase-like methyltransferase
LRYFDDVENVKKYLKMVEGYDGRELIKVLKTYLPNCSSVLELGMGPGKDLDILRKSFKVTGSDNSQVFLDYYKRRRKNVDLLLIDAVELNTKRKFDCIYSNKVLHHLTKTELKKSFVNQKKNLKRKGLLFHSFWYGNKVEIYKGIRFTYYTEVELLKMFSNDYELLELKRYKEMKKDDSMYVVLRKK